MPTAPHELLAYAEALTLADEVSARNAVGRAYYGAFHALALIVEAIRIPIPSDVGSHVAVCDAVRDAFRTCKTEDEKALRKAALILDTLRVIRHDADYKISSEFSVQRAQQGLSEARRIFEALRAVDVKSFH